MNSMFKHLSENGNAPQAYRRLRFEQMETRIALSADGVVVPTLNAEDITELIRSGVSVYPLEIDSTNSNTESATVLGDETVVTIESQVVDASGSAVRELQVGEEYTLRVFVQDSREQLDSALRGVFFAHVDLILSPNLAPSDTLVYSDRFQTAKRPGKIVTDQSSGRSVIENAGAVLSLLKAPGSEQQLLFETTFRVKEDADRSFIHVRPSDVSLEPFGVFGIDSVVPNVNVQSATWTPFSFDGEPNIDFPSTAFSENRFEAPLASPANPTIDLPTLDSEADAPIVSDPLQLILLLESGASEEDIRLFIAKSELEIDTHQLERLLAAAALSRGEEVPEVIAQPVIGNLSAAIRSEVRDQSGAVVNELEVGEQYSLRIYVQDTRSGSVSESQGGVFAAYIDLRLSENISLLDSIEFSEAFVNSQRTGEMSPDSQTGGSWIRNVGAIGDIRTDGSGVGTAEQFLLEAPFIVDSDAEEANIQVFPAQGAPEALLLFGANDAVPIASVVPSTLRIPAVSPQPIDPPIVADEPIPPVQPITSPPIIDVPTVIDAQIDTIEEIETPAISSDETATVLVSLTPETVLDSFDFELEPKVDGFLPGFIPIPDSVRALLQPFVDSEDSDFLDSIEIPNINESDSSEDDGLIELDLLGPSQLQPLQSKPEANDDELETNDDPSEEHLELLGDFWGDDLEEEELEPLSSRFRLDWRTYALNSSTPSDDDGTQKQTTDNIPAFDDGMIDLAEILHSSRPSIRSSANPRFSIQDEAIAQHASPRMNGKLGSAITFDLDHSSTRDSAQARVDLEPSSKTPSATRPQVDKATAKDPPNAE